MSHVVFLVELDVCAQLLLQPLVVSHRGKLISSSYEHRDGWSVDAREVYNWRFFLPVAFHVLLFAVVVLLKSSRPDQLRKVVEAFQTRSRRVVPHVDLHALLVVQIRVVVGNQLNP